MNLRSDSPYWLLHTPVLYTYNALQQDIETEIAVIGGGISGALVAHKLVSEGHHVTLVTAGHIADGSTCASTSLLQYEIDVPLYKLIKKTGYKRAVESYLLCHGSIDKLEVLHKKLGLSKNFQKRKSLLLASTKKDVDALKMEYESRLKIGIDVSWLSQNKLKKEFGLRSPAAVYSAKGGQTDAYLFTQTLVKRCADSGASVFDKTETEKITSNRQGVKLTTSTGYTIKARYAVMATGYETVNWINKNFTQLHSTYVIISEPVKKEYLWKDECLIWETATPYVYIRTTPDHRIIIGGKDEPFNSAHKRDSLLNIKSKQLLQTFQKKFPNIPFNIEYKWAGTFAETRDGLPFIGSIKEFPNVFFALGFGGNGITFSQIAADLISDKIAGRPNPDLRLFSFSRMVNQT